MSTPGAGFEYPRQAVSWLKRDALLFANSIGCTEDELHFLYVSPEMCQKPALVAFSDWDSGTAPQFPSLPHLLHHPSLQIYRPGCHRLLRSIKQHADPRCSKARLPPRCRWSEIHDLLQAAPPYVRRQQL